MITYFLLIFSNFVYLSLQISEVRSNDAISVVIFFADSLNVPRDRNGLDCLGMKEITAVPFTKHSETANHQPDCQRSTTDCEGILQNSINSLMRFCQTALGMKTALISVRSKKIINEISNEAPVPQPEYKEPRNLQSRDLNLMYPFNMQRPSPQKNIDEAFPQNNVVETVAQKTVDETVPQNTADGTVAAYGKFNKNLKDLVIGPEHTEIFKIRVKRDEMETELPREIVDIPLEKRHHKAPWDVLDIMSHVRYSFFGKLFEKDSHENLSKEGKEILNNIGQIQLDPGLFQTVMSTLSALQENSEPFLMVVFGGHLSEITDRHSPLIQSLKHVMETTVPEKTLVIMTGSCPGVDDNVVTINESVDGKNVNVPIFAKGPKSDKLSGCHVLYDIPLTVRSLLEELSPHSKIPEHNVIESP